MRLKKGLVTSKLDDGYIVIPTEGEDINKVLSLNDSGGFVWKLLEKDYPLDKIASLLSEEYGISYEQAEKDLNDFLKVIRPFVDTDNGRE